MDKETLRKVQLTQLDIAKEIKRVCDKNGIKYNLDSGTLLGAVRHQGFIPWDDDLDVGMAREEYEKFLKACETDLSDDYMLQTWYTDPEYPLPFAKIRKKNTVYIENVAQKNRSINGIFVDVFPYDHYVPKWHDLVSIKIPRYVLYRVILVKNGYRLAQDMNPIKYFLLSTPLRLLGLLFTNDFLKKQFDKMAVMRNDEPTNWYYPQGISNYGRWVMPKKSFDNLVLMKFEDDEFSCPYDYNAYLTKAYGDYMTLPPEDQRENRHRILEVKF